MTLGDDVPVAGLWGLGFSLSLQFLIAINMATSGFWWWPPAPNQRRFAESIRDLEHGVGVELEAGGFQVFQPPRPALTNVHTRSLVLCFTSLPHPNEPRAQAYIFFLGGLAFISLKHSMALRSPGLRKFSRVVQATPDGSVLRVSLLSRLKPQSSASSTKNIPTLIRHLWSWSKSLKRVEPVHRPSKSQTFI